MKCRAVAALYCVLILVTGSVNAVTQSASDVVRSTADSVLERITMDREELQNHPERIYDLINELVIPHFDFHSMSRWVLGTSWKNASAEQREAFVEQFKTLLVRTYAKALLEYSDEEIKYLDTTESANSKLVTVSTEMSGSGGTSVIPINYRLHAASGEWKVVDVTVDGISLISTYRGSFRSEINKNGLDSLIVKLTERNENLATTLTEAPTE